MSDAYRAGNYEPKTLDLVDMMARRAFHVYWQTRGAAGPGLLGKAPCSFLELPDLEQEAWRDAVDDVRASTLTHEANIDEDETGEEASPRISISGLQLEAGHTYEISLSVKGPSADVFEGLTGRPGQPHYEAVETTTLDEVRRNERSFIPGRLVWVPVEDQDRS